MSGCLKAAASIEIHSRAIFHRNGNEYCDNSYLNSVYGVNTVINVYNESRNFVTAMSSSGDGTCIDFNVGYGWSWFSKFATRDRSFFNGNKFYLGYTGGNWFGLGGNWNILAYADFTPRKDTGLINSSPIMNTPPFLRLQKGCTSSYTIPVVDIDGDDIKCRYPTTYDECGSVCFSAAPAKVSEDCTLDTSELQDGDFVITIIIEDFYPGESDVLSSTNLQFVLTIYTSNDDTCGEGAEYSAINPTDCVPINVGETKTLTIYARREGNKPIAEFYTSVTLEFGPLRKTQAALVEDPSIIPGLEAGHDWYFIDIEIKPQPSADVGQLCYTAIGSDTSAGTTQCFPLKYLSPPNIIETSLVPEPGFIFLKVDELVILYDRKISKSTKDTLPIITIKSAVDDTFIHTSELYSKTNPNEISLSDFSSLTVHRKYFVTIEEHAVETEADSSGCDAIIPSVEYDGSTSWTFCIVPDVDPPILDETSFVPVPGSFATTVTELSFIYNREVVKLLEYIHVISRYSHDTYDSYVLSDEDGKDGEEKVTLSGLSLYENVKYHVFLPEGIVATAQPTVPACNGAFSEEYDGEISWTFCIVADDRASPNVMEVLYPGRIELGYVDSIYLKFSERIALPTTEATLTVKSEDGSVDLTFNSPSDVYIDSYYSDDVAYVFLNLDKHALYKVSVGGGFLRNEDLCGEQDDSNPYEFEFCDALWLDIKSKNSLGYKEQRQG